MKDDACIFVGGANAWVFENFARYLVNALRVPISKTPKRWNYVLSIDEEIGFPESSFIARTAIEIAADKRILTKVFSENSVPSPITFLVDDVDQIKRTLDAQPDTSWCLKFPTSCGGAGHRFVKTIQDIPAIWPRPYVLQEFIQLRRPEVFRVYAAGGTTFGFVARRYPTGVTANPWVAHARGARYEVEECDCPEATAAAVAALRATGLLKSFGCVDLIQRPSGEWLALEVGTDGIYNHVDRDIGDLDFEAELNNRVSQAFHAYIGSQ